MALRLAGWNSPEAIAAAQSRTTYVIDGVARERVAYGAETDDWGPTAPLSRLWRDQGAAPRPGL